VGGHPKTEPPITKSADRQNRQTGEFCGATFGEFSRVIDTRVAHDLLDRRAASGAREDRGVGVLASQVTLILEPFGGSQQFGIDDRRAHDGADLAHRFAHGVQKGVAGVFHEMPAIGDLHGRR
jgi:hypothetical protein